MIKGRLTYANVVGTLALFLALAGGAWALASNTVRSRHIVDDSVKSKDLKNDGVKFKDLKDVVDIEADLAFGGNKTLVEHGSLRLTAQCLQNTTDDGGNPNSDVLRVLVVTTEDGAQFDGTDAKRGGATADYLDTTTPAGDRVWEELSVATGSADFSAPQEDGAGLDADGRGLIVPDDAMLLSVNQGGSDCRLEGVAHLVK